MRLTGQTSAKLTGKAVCAWAGVAGMAAFLAGLFIAGFLPPLPPDTSPAVLADLYKTNAPGIRICALLCTYAASLIVMFFGAITAEMRRLEGEYAPLAYAQLGLGVIICVAFVIPAVGISMLAFRADRPLAVIQAFHDASFLMLIMPTAGVLQALVVGLAIYNDTSVPRRFPRWIGHFNIFAAIAAIPGTFIIFFHAGPFAWNGAFAFWSAAIVFGVWIGVMTWGLLNVPDDRASSA